MSAKEHYVALLNCYVHLLQSSTHPEVEKWKDKARDQINLLMEAAHFSLDEIEAHLELLSAQAESAGLLVTHLHNDGEADGIL